MSAVLKPDPALPVLEVDHLSVDIATPRGTLRAVRDVSFQVKRGETLCIVGESGCGKSITSLAIMSLLPAAAKRRAERLSLLGEDLLKATPRRVNALRGDRMAMIFQEPMTALNPVLTIGDQIEEVLRIHTDLGPAERRAQVLAMLEAMRLPEPERMHASYPHQISGGQRQRVMIAAALILDPALLIADEPTTALDVTTQAQILKLIKDMQSRRGTGVLFSFRICACVVTSSAVVGSSAISKAGSRISAAAIITRWRCPPEIWCG